MAKFYSNEEVSFLKENAPKFGAVICAEKLGRSVSSVRRKLSSLKISSKKVPNITEEDIKNLCFKSSFKELIVDFKKTNTPKELAYFIGFFWADGYVREKDNNLLLEIVEKDAEDLKHIFNRIATFSVYRREREGRQPQVTFRYHDKNLVSFFINLGKYAHSTESHKMVLDIIPEKYQIYFLRGLIDGDGNFYIGTKGSIQFSIAASYEQDWDSLKSKLETYGLTLSVQKACSDKGTSSHIRCSNTCLIKNFITNLYKVKDNIWLERKYIKAMEILER